MHNELKINALKQNVELYYCVQVKPIKLKKFLCSIVSKMTLTFKIQRGDGVSRFPPPPTATPLTIMSCKHGCQTRKKLGGFGEVTQ